MGSRSGEGEDAFFEDARETGVAVLLAAAFFALGLSTAERDFFLGVGTRFPLAAGEADSAVSVSFFSASVLDFFATCAFK